MNTISGPGETSSQNRGPDSGLAGMTATLAAKMSGICPRPGGAFDESAVPQGDRALLAICDRALLAVAAPYHRDRVPLLDRGQCGATKKPEPALDHLGSCKATGFKIELHFAIGRSTYPAHGARDFQSVPNIKQISLANIAVIVAEQLGGGNLNMLTLTGHLHYFAGSDGSRQLLRNESIQGANGR